MSKFKMCKTCNKKLLANREYFFVNNRLKDGLFSDCKKCAKKRLKTYRDNISNKVKCNIRKYRNNYYNSTNGKHNRNYHFKKNYGITLEEYNNILSKQNGKCAICELKQKKRNLSVDHCHITNKIRGLLCTNCNRGIGMLKEDISLLRKAIKYLNKNA